MATVVGFVVIVVVGVAKPEFDGRVFRDAEGPGAAVDEEVVLEAAELLADTDTVPCPASPEFDAQPAIIAAAVSAAANAGMRFIALNLRRLVWTAL